MDRFTKFFQLTKVDEATHTVYGVVTAEAEDHDGEWCDYATTRTEYEKVNAELGKASDGANIMPLREMHQLSAVGAGKSINFDDAAKKISMGFKVVDEAAWRKVMEKVYLGFSQGGKYVKQWVENGRKMYTAQPGEVSLVDHPCLPGAYIEYAKADGAVELYKPKPPAIPPGLTEAQVQKLLDAQSTRFEEKLSKIGEVVRKDIPLGDHMKMTVEQLKKAADALGMKPEEFSKLIADTVIEENLGKGHSIAALHAHLEKVHAHHTAHHEAMVKAHEAHTAHLEKAMKMCKAVMGADEKESEKVMKELLAELKIVEGPKMVSIGKTADGVEIFKAEGAKDTPEITKVLTPVNNAGGISPEQMQKAIDDAVNTALANNKIRVIPRGGDAKISEEEEAKLGKAAAAGTAF